MDSLREWGGMRYQAENFSLDASHKSVRRTINMDVARSSVSWIQILFFVFSPHISLARSLLSFFFIMLRVKTDCGRWLLYGSKNLKLSLAHRHDDDDDEKKRDSIKFLQLGFISSNPIAVELIKSFSRAIAKSSRHESFAIRSAAAAHTAFSPLLISFRSRARELTSKKR